MSEDRKMTVRKLMSHLRRFPRDAEIVELEVSVMIDPQANLVQSLTLLDEDDEDEPDDPEREDLPEDRDSKVISMPPRRTRA